MRILLTVDPEIPVPPVLYGGIERIVDGLAKGYSNEGHEVYLVAHGDSTCSYTKKNFAWPARRSGGMLNILKNMLYLTRVVKQEKPDVVHSFSRLLYGYPLFLFTKVSFLQTYQREISPRSTNLAYRLSGRRLRFTACAAHMIMGLPNQEAFSPVFNFSDADYFTPPDTEERLHLLFLGRIEDIKGTKEAIEAAIATSHKIIVAGNTQHGHEGYFEKEIRPLLANGLVDYVGPVNDEEKRHYLQGAKALLFPIKWEEPFGIVLAEALCCGVPVIGYNRGSVPEVVIDGFNGFICSGQAAMEVSILKISNLNPDAIRQDAIKRFSREVVTKQYLEQFNEMRQDK